VSPPPLFRQEEWNRLFSKLERFVDRTQEDDGSNNDANLESAVAAFKKQQRLTPRQSMGLDQMVDANWMQEYAARYGLFV